MTDPTLLRYSLLDEALVRWRCVARTDLHRSSLPDLFAAMSRNEVRDFPALRPHQRHPWHAFLVQLAAIALHRGGQTQPWSDAADWHAALLALTPDDADGAAWCLVAPPERPALLQAPVPGERVADWRNLLHAADELDMLVTSKNHDLKVARLRLAEADDWLFALISLQTQEGFLGAGNYGISRMNGGFASRPGVGVAPIGHWGARWAADVRTRLAQRADIAEQQALADEGGHALQWLLPWSGADSLAMQGLDPLYIEIGRRVRLADVGGAKHNQSAQSEPKRHQAPPATPGRGLWRPLSKDGWPSACRASTMDPTLWWQGLPQQSGRDLRAQSF